MATLDQIDSFGGVAAENDAHLADFFIRTAAYRRIVNQERFVVIGRKGTGKTAIYRNLQEQVGEQSESVSVGLDFLNYPSGVIRSLRTQSQRRSSALQSHGAF